MTYGISSRYGVGQSDSEAPYNPNESIGLYSCRKVDSTANRIQPMRHLQRLQFSTCGHIYEILEQVRAQVAVVQPPKFNRFAHSFSHIFAGGYAAGYYSYKWAEVLSSDAFSLFEEKGIFDRETGKAFLTTILEQGGSQDAMDLFIKFRSRKPAIDALLRHNGIIE